MTLTNIISYIPFIIGIGILIFTIYNRDRISRFIHIKNLSKVEYGYFKNLKRVIVVANQVEKPLGSLEDAVENNFKKNVKYTFLISKERAKKEINGYYLLFEALAKKAIAEMEEKVRINELIEIKNLTYNWPDVPYLFYQYETEGGEILTTAFRGNQKGEGIADAYEQLKDTHSLAIASALLAEAPEDIKSDLKVVVLNSDVSLQERKLMIR